MALDLMCQLEGVNQSYQKATMNYLCQFYADFVCKKTGGPQPSVVSRCQLHVLVVAFPGDVTSAGRRLS